MWVTRSQIRLEPLHKPCTWVRRNQCTIPTRDPQNILTTNSSLSPEELKKLKQREYSRMYREKNKERLNGYMKQYMSGYRETHRDAVLHCALAFRQRNSEKMVEYTKKYREENKEAIAEKQKEYHMSKKDQISARKKEYYKNNLDKIRQRHQRNKDKIRIRSKLYMRKYRQENVPKRDATNLWKLREKRRIYRLENKEKIQNSRKIYTQANSEKLAAYYRKYWKNYSSQKKGDLKDRWKLYYLLNKDLLLRKKQEYKKKTRMEVERNLRENAATIRSDIEKELEIATPSDWYNFYLEEIIARTSSQMSKVFAYLPMLNILKILYPEQTWEPWKFKHTIHHTWKDPKNVRSLLDSTRPKLRINSIEDWYRVSRKQLFSAGGGGIFTNFGSLGHALIFAYPEVEWDPLKFFMPKKRAKQRWLRITASSLLGNEPEMQENYLHPDLLWEGDRKMELDIWIPDEKLALEYQGEQHYHGRYVEIFGRHSAIDTYAHRDEEKMRSTKVAGIRLVFVPYWWDDTQEALDAVIKEQYPEFKVRRSRPRVTE